MALVQNRIVVKVGTSSLTNDVGNTNLKAFDKRDKYYSHN